MHIMEWSTWQITLQGDIDYLTGLSAQITISFLTDFSSHMLIMERNEANCLQSDMDYVTGSRAQITMNGLGRSAETIHGKHHVSQLLDNCLIGRAELTVMGHRRA